MSSNTICPNCDPTKAPSLRTYPDGTWCFRCHVYTPQLSMFYKKHIKNREYNIEKKAPLVIEAMKWLAKYNITAEHVDKHYIYWNEDLQRIVFPRYATDGSVESAWCRSIDQQPKWLFSTKEESPEPFIFCKDHAMNSLVIVEDIVSAIRVADYMDALSLCGTSFNREKLLPIVKQYENVIIFLDGDEAGKEGTKKIRKEIKLYVDVKVIYNRKDPKEYDPEELKEVLYDNRNVRM